MNYVKIYLETVKRIQAKQNKNISDFTLDYVHQVYKVLNLNSTYINSKLDYKFEHKLKLYILQLWFNSGLQKHHVIPQSFDGNNSKENLVWVTPREHCFLHLILSKIFLKETQARITQIINNDNHYLTMCKPVVVNKNNKGMIDNVKLYEGETIDVKRFNKIFHYSNDLELINKARKMLSAYMTCLNRNGVEYGKSIKNSLSNLDNLEKRHDGKTIEQIREKIKSYLSQFNFTEQQINCILNIN